MTEQEKESLYAEALELKSTNVYESVLKAYRRFVELEDYKDSPTLAKECKAIIDEADSFVGKVYEKKKKIKKANIALLVIVALMIMSFLVYDKIILRELNYREAVELYEQGSYDEARAIFEKLGKYKNSADFLKESSQKTEIAVGNTIYFGSIEQDNDGYPEYIEWIVLDIVDNKALLLSKYAIYNYMYDDEEGNSPWCKSLLRTWLNEDFLTKCFDRDEWDRIIPVTVSADRNPYYEQNFVEENSWDRVFVLSASELEKYLDSNEKRMCYTTPYARYYGAILNYETLTTFYWTRTQGSTNNNVVSVDSSGEIFYAGSVKTSIRRAVRPALWINLEGFQDKEHENPDFEDIDIDDNTNEDYIN